MGTSTVYRALEISTAFEQCEIRGVKTTLKYYYRIHAFKHVPVITTALAVTGSCDTRT